MKSSFFEVYKDKSKRRQCWRWRFVHPKDGIIAKSEEPFALRRNCERSIKIIQAGKWLKENFISSKTNTIYWAIKSKNGRTIGMSPKGYDSVPDLEKDWKIFKRRFAKAILILSEND